MASITEIRKVQKSPERPGWILWHQFMNPNKISQVELAKAIDVKQNRISDIIYDKRRITANTALRLATFFGNQPKFWLNLQNDWDIKQELAAYGAKKQLERIKTIEKIKEEREKSL